MLARAEATGLQKLTRYCAARTASRSFDSEVVRCAVACVLRLRPDLLRVPDKFASTAELEEQVRKLAALHPNEGLFEVLFTRRVDDLKDKHSGQVCFPGGKLDEGENEQVACEREVFEEIGVDLNQKGLYLGKMTDEAFIYHRSNKKVLISACTYFASNNLQMNLSKTEISEASWVPMTHFFDYQPNHLRYREYAIPPKLLINAFCTEQGSAQPEVAGLLAEYKNEVEKDKIQNGLWYFDLPGLSRPLWGITQLMASSLIQVWRNEHYSQAQLVKSQDFCQRGLEHKTTCQNPQLAEYISQFLRRRSDQFLVQPATLDAL